MKLGSLKPNTGATRDRKRVGRGQGSGQGCTAGRGNKGHKSRSGFAYRPWFEGGQMPLQRRMPKRGFRNTVHETPSEAVNVSRLAGLGGNIDAGVLKEHGLIGDPKARLKIMGFGELTEAVTVRAHAVTDSARRKIEEAGGRIELIVVPRRPKRFKKKSERK